MATETKEQNNDTTQDGLTVNLSEEFDNNPLISSIIKEAPAGEEEEQSSEGEEEPNPENVEEEESEESENEEEPETEEEDHPTEIDVDALTPEQRVNLAAQLDSDFKERLDSLSSEKSELEKRAQELESQLDSGMKSFVSSDDAYPNAKTPEEVKQNMQNDYQWRTQLMSIITDQSPEEDDQGNEGYVIRNKFYPKQEVVDTIKQIDGDIFRAPEQLRKFEKLGEVASTQAESLEQAKGYAWFEDDKSPAKLKYNEVMQNPEVKLLSKVAPSFAAKLPAIVAGWADKTKPRKKASMKLPLRRNSGSGSIASSAGGSGSGLRDPQRAAARKKLNDGNYSPEDVVKSFFM